MLRMMLIYIYGRLFDVAKKKFEIDRAILKYLD